jgi:hypothetical protein
MHFSPARLVTAVATLALIALPGSAFAQSNPAQNPPSQPPTQTQPQAQPPAPQQPPAASSATTAASGQVDATAAKQHLTEARDALSQLASMPEAAKLQGDARTKVSELISNFNALITTQADWRASYGKVNDSVTALLGPDTTEPSGTAATTGTGTAGTTGTTGTTAAGSEANAAPAAGVQLDPAIRAKLVEFRTHLKEFEKSAGGAQAPSPESAASSPSKPPSAAPDSTSNPSSPASAVSGATGTSGSEQMKPSATGTSGTTSAAAPASSADQNPNATAQSELAAIDAILATSKTGALTKTQTDEIKRHLEALRALLK